MAEQGPRAIRDWSIDSREPLYEGRRCRIERVRFRHALHAGGDSGAAEQELFSRGDVVGVLLHDPTGDRVLLIEQFRLGAMHRAPDPWLWEVVAGGVEPGESPERAAGREAREEAGLELAGLRPLARYLASPGISTDEVFLYVGSCDLSGAGGFHGLATEGEDIRVRVVPAERAIAMVGTGEIGAALSIVALQAFALERARAGM